MVLIGYRCIHPRILTALFPTGSGAGILDVAMLLLRLPQTQPDENPARHCTSSQYIVKVESLLLNARVDFIALADYSENRELDIIVKDIILKMVIEDNLKRKNKKQIEAINKDNWVKACDVIAQGWQSQEKRGLPNSNG